MFLSDLRSWGRLFWYLALATSNRLLIWFYVYVTAPWTKSFCIAGICFSCTMSNGHLSLHYVSISGLSMDITQLMLVISYHISCYQTISSRGQKKEVSRNKQAIVKSLYWILLRFIFSLVNGHNGWPIFILLLRCSKCILPMPVCVWDTMLYASNRDALKDQYN